ncbi:hypothetical protein PIB30_074693, partial [Stylosanthes scabra]|nr:hypothetical protein [Stylosanthes scabra]
MDNCFEFTGTTKGGHHLITTVDLGKVKNVYKVKALFTLELRHINWGVFYRIIWDEYFREVLGSKMDSLYVPNSSYGISQLWNVIATPSYGSNQNFKFQLLPSKRRTEHKLGGDWQSF